MAKGVPRVGIEPSRILDSPPMAGQHMPNLSGMHHTDSAAGDIGYHPLNHYRPQAGRADRLMANQVGTHQFRGGAGGGGGGMI